MIGFTWSCTCGSAGRRIYAHKFEAERERARHERLRCSPMFASQVDTLSDRPTIPLDTADVAATDTGTP